MVWTKSYDMGRLPLRVVGNAHIVADEVLEWVGADGLLVMEDFMLMGRVGSTDREGLSPVQVSFSMYSYMMAQGWEARLELQLPAQAISVMTDERLRKLGYWDGRNAHERDAVRHGLMWLRRDR